MSSEEIYEKFYLDDGTEVLIRTNDDLDGPPFEIIHEQNEQANAWNTDTQEMETIHFLRELDYRTANTYQEALDMVNRYKERNA